MLTYELDGTCDYCTRRVRGLGYIDDSGVMHHIACRELIARADGWFDAPQEYEVTVSYSGTVTVRVAARSEDEALDLACEYASDEVHDADDFDADTAELTGEEPGESQLRALERHIEREAQREARRKERARAAAARPADASAP